MIWIPAKAKKLEVVAQPEKKKKTKKRPSRKHQALPILLAASPGEIPKGDVIGVVSCLFWVF
jgi:hypothetical protein